MNPAKPRPPRAGRHPTKRHSEGPRNAPHPRSPRRRTEMHLHSPRYPSGVRARKACPKRAAICSPTARRSSSPGATGRSESSARNRANSRQRGALAVRDGAQPRIHRALSAAASTRSSHPAPGCRIASGRESSFRTANRYFGRSVPLLQRLQEMGRHAPPGVARAVARGGRAILPECVRRKTRTLLSDCSPRHGEIVLTLLLGQVARDAPRDERFDVHATRARSANVRRMPRGLNFFFRPTAAAPWPSKSVGPPRPPRVLEMRDPLLSRLMEVQCITSPVDDFVSPRRITQAHPAPIRAAPVRMRGDPSVAREGTTAYSRPARAKRHDITRGGIVDNEHHTTQDTPNTTAPFFWPTSRIGASREA